MKNVTLPARLSLLAGAAVGLFLLPLSSLRADDHGGGTPSPGHHGGDDDGGGTRNPEDHGKVELLGTLQSLPATAGLIGVWTVDGRAVSVDAATLIRKEHGEPVVGGRLEVEGILQADGGVLASVVKTEDDGRLFEDNVFFGEIQALPSAGIVGTWRVAGLTVQVTAATRVETEAGAPALGSPVRVEGAQQPDGSFVASEINVQAAAPTTAAPVKLKGVIQRLPATFDRKGNWIIDDTVVTVTDDSFRVSGGRKPKVGRKVVVKGAAQINGSILAARVKVPAASH